VKVFFQSSVPGGHENYFDELMAIMEASKGRPDAVEFGSEAISGRVMAAVDFEAVAGALQAGELPCASSEGQVLRLATSIAGGLPVDLGDAVSGLDSANAGLVAEAVLHAAGHRDLMVRGAW
jgi:hypothetical protein